jgi:hypothetical protein
LWNRWNTPFFIVTIPVQGATVTLHPRTSTGNPGITLKTRFGNMNVTNIQTLDSFTVYSNGTIFFDLRGNEGLNRYDYIVTSYGNGTLPIVFALIIPPLQVVKSNTLSESYRTGIEKITYNTNQQSPLSLIFGIKSSTNYFNGANVIAVVFGAAAILISFVMVRDNKKEYFGLIIFLVAASIIFAIFGAIIAGLGA